MTKKIYRLADKGDIGKEVYFTDSLEFAKNEGISNFKGILKEIIQASPYGSFFYVGDRTMSHHFAFIEVIPADFTDDQIKAEYLKRFKE